MSYEISIDRPFRDVTRHEQRPGAAFEFPAGKPPLTGVSTPRRVAQAQVPTAGQAAGAGARMVGQAIDRATSGFTLDTRPEQASLPSITAPVIAAPAGTAASAIAQARTTRQEAASPRSGTVVLPAGEGLGLLRPPQNVGGASSSDAYAGTGGVLDPSRRPAIDAFLAAGKQDQAEARARQRLAIDRSTAAEGQIARRNALENAARTARIDAARLTGGGAGRFQPRGAALAARQSAANLAAAAADAQGIELPGGDFDETSIARGFATADASKAQADLTRQQATAAGIATQGAQRQADLQQQLAALSPDNPNRRALIDQLLAGQGKDPDAGRFLSIDVLGPDDASGFPQRLRGALDARTGQVLGGGTGSAGTASVGGKFTEGAIIRQNGQTFRIVDGQPVPIETKVR